MSISTAEQDFAAALKSIARNPDIKSRLLQSPELHRILSRAARRFTAGDRREPAVGTAAALAGRGYAVSLEHIGENTGSEPECELAVQEFSRLIDACVKQGLNSRISLDLSHIGLSLDRGLALRNLTALAEKASAAGLQLFVSMEEAAKTSSILDVYREAAERSANLGITLQAQLPRSLGDLTLLKDAPGAVRIVKGAYQEPEGVSIPRSGQLDARYLELVGLALEQGKQTSIATHDRNLIREADARGYVRHPLAELEMLYGIVPESARDWKESGVSTLIYVTYGEEWYLYLCHRIAEHPPNLYDAVTDMIRGGSSVLEAY